MATTTRRGMSARLPAVIALGLGLLALPRGGLAVVLDDRGEMRLGLRAYTAVRIGTERMGGEDNPLTFPQSGAGNVRQHRYFLEVKLDHDIRRIASTGYGLGRLFGWLDPSTLKYSLQYRGEGEGIYDYGPDEFTDSFAAQKRYKLEFPDVAIGTLKTSSTPPDAYVQQRVRKLRRVARQRHRFFLGYLDFEKGPVFIRIGRQILAWGETDIFRLLDNINPLDQGFGGFLIALDERRVPLDMLRGSYQIGSVGPVDDAWVEAFGALGNRTATQPGIPPGSPWEPGGLGAPNPVLEPQVRIPAAEEFRGGARLVFNAHDITFTLAHYWTYLDTPGVVFEIPPGLPSFPKTIKAVQRVPRVPITGASATFPVPSWYTVVRSEAAYFYNEPYNRQGRGSAFDATFPADSPQGRRLASQHNDLGGLNPFLYPGFLNLIATPTIPTTRTTPILGKLLTLNSFNYAVGLDINRFIRQLNAGQTFFITTQFFYKHVFDSPGDLVLPVPVRNTGVDPRTILIGTAPLLKTVIGCPFPRPAGQPAHACRLQPRLIHINDNQFLHTLLITTSYRGGRIVPSYGMFYDWQGALLFQPGIAFVRDPFRFIFDYTRIESPLGAGQISALRDRDNVRFQVEFVF